MVYSPERSVSKPRVSKKRKVQSEGSGARVDTYENNSESEYNDESVSGSREVEDTDDLYNYLI